MVKLIKNNKKGQAWTLGFMFAVMLFITVVIMIEPLKEGIDIARDSSHLNCSSPAGTLSTGRRATCILVDMWLFYFVGVGLAGAGAFLVGKKIGGK